MVAKAPAKKTPRGSKPNTPRSGNKSPKPGQGPLNTSKGQFTFTMVSDGCYIEHKVILS